MPPDAVTASGSGLDYQISARRTPTCRRPAWPGSGESTSRWCEALIRRYTTGRALGFMGQPAVNVLELNLALDRSCPYHSG